MDIVAPFVADGEPPEPMEPGERTFDHPAEDPEPAAMRTAGLGDDRDNALRREAGVALVRPVGAIALDTPGLRRERPRRPATACKAATIGSSWVTSFTLAAVSWARSGTPRASVRR